MSVGADTNPEQTPSPLPSTALAKGQQPEGENATRPEANSTPSIDHASLDAKTDSSPESKDSDSDSAQINSTTSLLASLWSPISSLLQSSSSTSPSPSSSAPNTEPSSSKSSPSQGIEEMEVFQEPEPYYTPESVPLFKTLQKTRLSGTRTKQLLRAASRAYNDSPPPPELGSCCGSSCDPCVNDLWREERDVWRGRWGDRGVEDDKKKDEDEGEGDGKGNGGTKKMKKKKEELEW